MIYKSRFKVIFKYGDFSEKPVINDHYITLSSHFYRKNIQDVLLTTRQCLEKPICASLAMTNILFCKCILSARNFAGHCDRVWVYYKV